MAISIFALPFFSLASISIARSPSGYTVISSSPIESDNERARIPSAMRFSASAASEGVAAPSNSNSRLSPITIPSGRSDSNQWTPRPSKLDADVIRALPLLGLDLEDDELGRRQLDLLIPHGARQLARQHALGQLRQVERSGVAACPGVKLRGNRCAHLLPLYRPRQGCGLGRRHRRDGLCAGGPWLTDCERLRYDVSPASRVPGHQLRGDQVLAVETAGRGDPLAITLP